MGASDDDLHLAQPTVNGMASVFSGKAEAADTKKELEISGPNTVWSADITCIPMPRGFLYPVAVIDWATTKGLCWTLSITIEADFGIEALEKALAN